MVVICMAKIVVLLGSSNGCHMYGLAHWCFELQVKGCNRRLAREFRQLVACLFLGVRPV